MKCNISEADLICSITQCSKAGITELYDRYSSSIYTVIYCNVKQRKLADDILEQTFLQAYRTFGTFHQQPYRLHIWLMGIARKLSKECLTLNLNGKISANPAIEVVSHLI